MCRAFSYVIVCSLCLAISACSKSDAKKDGGQASAKKGDSHDDHKGHDHGAGGDRHDENDENDHRPSDTPLVIVDDVVAASNGHAKEKFANEHARVLAIELHKGEGLPLHKGGPRVVYPQTDLKIKFIDVHGDHVHSHDAQWKAGKVHAHGAGTHGVDNLADDPAKFVVFLRKASGKFTASVPDGAKTISESTKFATTLLSNDDFRVMKVALPSGEKTGQHYALNQIVYALGSGKLTFSYADGKPEEQELTEGKITYHEAGLRAVENSGDGVVVFLIIEMKK